MKFLAAVALIVLSCARPSAASDSGSPVEKVVKLLADLQAKIKADGGKEKALFEKYSCWCTGMTSKKGAAIQQAKKDLKKLGSDILSLRGKVAKYSSDIKDAAQDMQDNHKDQQKATKARDLENAAFTATHAEMSQALQSLNQALKMLKMAPQFLQTHSSLSTEAAEAVRSAIAAIPDKALGSLPEAKLSQIQKIGTAVAQGKYDPSYGSLVTILEEMDATFADDLAKETSTESTSNKDYQDLMDTKVKELTTLQEIVDKREEEKAVAASDLADTTQNYDDTEAQMEADIEFFDNAVDSCEKKAQAWETRTEMRDEELAGIEKAIEILTGDDARALFAKAIDAGARTGASFLQVDEMPGGQQKAFKAIKSMATRSQNMVFAKLAAQVRLAQGGHFDEVMGAIDKVIGVLKTEQGEDNKKKTQCNEEYKKVASTSADEEWQIEKNEAEIEKLEATIADREEQKAATINSIEETKQEIIDMKKERKEANEDFKEAKKDDEDALTLLRSAKDALTAFYKKHNLDEALGAFMQGAEPKFDRGDMAPDAKFSDKGTRSGQTNGIVKLFTMIIDGLVEEVRVQVKIEKAAVESYDKALKAAEGLQKTLETKRDNLKGEIADRNKDKDDEDKLKEGNEGDLKDEVDYKKKIQPDCDFMLKSWQERFNKRKAEMDGLVTAKDFLAGAMNLAQTSKSKGQISIHK